VDRNASAELAAPARKADAQCDAAGQLHCAVQAGGFRIVPEFSQSSPYQRATVMLRKLLFILPFIGLASLAACMSPPSGLNLSLDRLTAHDKYRVTVHSLADPVTINKMHAWEIRLRSPSDEAVQGARISVNGGMPQHGHGFPTQPRVTQELGDGRYLLEGMKFSMPGWWEIKLKIAAASGEDEVTFNAIIASGAAPSGAGNVAKR
jgi:YtkA-like